MNRREKQRMYDRRREYHAPRDNHFDWNSSESSKSLMDNYFQSQKNIQSISEDPSGVNEVKVATSFRIPKKQPGRSNNEAEIYNSEIDRNSRTTDVRDQFGKRTRTSRSSPWKRGEGDTLNNSRRSVDLSRPRREPNQREEDQARHSSETKRIRLGSPSRRDQAELNFDKGYTTIEKVRLKNRLLFNQPINIIIADRAAPNGKISQENAKVFLNEIQQSVAKRILTNPRYQTKFIDHKHENGLITMTCADEFTSMFIQQKLTEDLPLWPGAKLEWSFGHFKSCFISLIIPNSIGHLSEFLENCKKTDSRMQTEKWRRIECEHADDDSGKLFILAIDKQSYEIMKQQGNLVRCGNLNINIKLDALNLISEELRLTS